MRIPLAQPEITEADIAAVTGVLRTPILSIGPQIESFERAMAQYAGAKYGVGANSGTSALHLALRAYGLRQGDEVIVPSFAFVAVGNVLLQEHLVPVFVDVEEGSFNLDPAQATAAITNRTRAILLVHTFGFPARIAAFRKLADEHKLVLIEDASEALGATVNGQRVGGFGDVGIFAFYPNKAITTGEGGMLVTSDEKIAATCRRLRNQGREPSTDWYQHHEVGFSYRLPEMNCALGLSQLGRMSQILERRAAIAKAYHERLRGVAGIELPRAEAGTEVGWFTYPVRLAAHYGLNDRDRLWSAMNAQGVGCARYFAPLHKQPAMQGQIFSDLSRTERLAKRVFQLPFFNQITTEQIEVVADTLEQLVAEL